MARVGFPFAAVHSPVAFFGSAIAGATLRAFSDANTIFGHSLAQGGDGFVCTLANAT